MASTDTATELHAQLEESLRNLVTSQDWLHAIEVASRFHARKGKQATGTPAGYQRHARAGEAPCVPCRQANAEAGRRRRAGAPSPAPSPAQIPANLPAALRTVAELRRLGRLEAVDAARVQALLGLAEAVDANPWSAPLWERYREALKVLRETDGPTWQAH